MSLRGGRKPDVAAQLSATKERYRCGVPLAGAIRPNNVSIIWEFGIKRRVLRIRIATATGGLAMTVRNLIPYS